MIPGDVERAFWDRVEITNGCWLWRGAKLRSGYGSFFWRGKRMRAHRVALWLATCLPVPQDKVVMHRCDMPLCVRPDHLAVGTQADNLMDMAAKRRSTHGERNRHARLTASQVQAIRERYAAGGIRQRDLAREYGVSQSHVSGLIAGRFWTHLDSTTTWRRVGPGPGGGEYELEEDAT